MIFKIGLERLGDEVVVEMKPDKVSLAQVQKNKHIIRLHFWQVLSDQEDSDEEVANISSRIYCFK